MQKGCGTHGAVNAAKLTFVWACVSFLLLYFTFFNVDTAVTRSANTLWMGAMVMFYACLWFLPDKRLFR